MSIKLIVANSIEALKLGLAPFKATATVEAEYGGTVLEGTILTLAHHGERRTRPCPCSIPNLPNLGITAIGISHMDLDTLGGIMAIERSKPVTEWNSFTEEEEYHEVDLFWETAAFIDMNGVHKLDEFLKCTTIETKLWIKERLNAWWAYNEAHRLPIGAIASDVTETVQGHINMLTDILLSNNDRNYIQHIIAGRRWAEERELVEKKSFIMEEDGVVLRNSYGFTNHLYTPTSKVVVAHRSDFKSVTISVAEQIDGFSCKTEVQELWGPDAGGNDGIAGSPRNREMTTEDAKAAFEHVKETLKKAFKE